MYPVFASCASVTLNDMLPLVTPLADVIAEFAAVGDALSTANVASWWFAR